MNAINIMVLTETNLIHMKKNIKKITSLVKENYNNDWIYEEFSNPVFSTKAIKINDFKLELNEGSSNKDVDFENSVKLYENLKDIPRYVLTDEKFWLWLYLEKFYLVTKSMMEIKSSTTIKDHWMHSQGKHRGLMFGVLSRCYFRVELTIDDTLNDKYLLTRWIINNTERFRNLTWRSMSSQPGIVRGVLKGEYSAIVKKRMKEDNSVYPIIGKYVSEIGSARLLDVVSEDDLCKMVYNKMIELLK